MEWDESRPLWTEISAGALRLNYARVRAAAGADVPVLAVVKANAYGHGAAGCAPVLAAEGAEWLGVTDVAEGVLVRRALGILPQTVQPRVLVMCGVWPGNEADCLRHGLTPVVWESFHLQVLEREAAARGMGAGSVAVHVEIDTGMARQGVAPGEALGALLREMAGAVHLRLEGVLTHFASAECMDSAQNGAQREVFLTALLQVRGAAFAPEIVHAGNSSGIDGGGLEPWLAEAARATGARPMARAGLALYGYALPLEGAEAGRPRLAGLVPVLAWKTRIVSLRRVETGATVGYNGTFVAPGPMQLALLPVGYADGFRRALSSTNERVGAEVLVQGRRVPVVGRISMDLSVVDVSALGEVGLGEKAVLIGGAITAAEMGALAGTSAYEVLCGIAARVPRRMVE